MLMVLPGRPLVGSSSSDALGIVISFTALRLLPKLPEPSRATTCTLFPTLATVSGILIDAVQLPFWLIRIAVTCSMLSVG